MSDSAEDRTSESRPTRAASELLRSGLRFGWAMSVFGAESMARTLGGGKGVAEALESVAAEAERQLGASSREMLRSGERLRQDLAALWAGSGEFARERGHIGRALVEGGTGGARRIMQMLAPLGGESFERSADLLFAAENFAGSALEPGSALENGAALENHLLESLEGLRTRATRLLALDPFTGLWRLEGSGYAYGRALGEARGTLCAEALDLGSLPVAAHMPILTGAALALARRLLRPALPGGELEENTRRHAELCHRLAPAGSGLMFFEATGFVAHQLMPLRLKAMAQAASSLGEKARAAFYHGVGRALYLSLRGLVDARHPLARAASLDEESARHNATAGVVWAATLVHLRHPGQVESLLDRCTSASGEAVAGAAVEHGLAGALTVWLNHLRGRVEDPFEEEHVAALRQRRSLWPRLEKAFERARRRIDDFERDDAEGTSWGDSSRGDSSWDSVYVYVPERRP